MGGEDDYDSETEFIKILNQKLPTQQEKIIENKA
jgi:hypothetical protein